MRENTNKQAINGRIFQHSLEKKTVTTKTSANYGKEFISGEVQVAVDEEGINVIPVHFSFVTATTKSGKTNSTFTALEKIINGAKTWQNDGKEAAETVLITNNSYSVKDFITREGELAMQKRNEGGFITLGATLDKDLDKRHEFEIDFFITSAVRKEAADEESQDELVLSGYAFGYKNTLLPAEFVIRDTEGMNYFELQDISERNPFYTTLIGVINNTSIKTTKTQESAWGAPIVTTTSKKVREWEVKAARATAFEVGVDITSEDMTKAAQDRQIHLAEVKKSNEEYLAKKNTATAAPSIAPTNGGFSF